MNIDGCRGCSAMALAEAMCLDTHRPTWWDRLACSSCYEAAGRLLASRSVEGWADDWDVRPLIQERLAEAWDEGFAAWQNVRTQDAVRWRVDNPYRDNPPGPEQISR